MKNNTQSTENKVNKDTVVAMNKDTEATETKVTTDETTIIPLKKYASSHKESVSNASSIFNVPPDSLYIEEGFNLRDIYSTYFKMHPPIQQKARTVSHSLSLPVHLEVY